MPFFLDPDKSAEDNFFDLVLSENPKAQYLKGRVTAVNPVTDLETGLTTVQLIPIPGQGYSGMDSISYHRLPPVPASGTQNKGEITINSDLPQSQLKTLIADYHRLVEEDVVIRGLNGATIVTPEIGTVFTPDAGFRVMPNQSSLIYDDASQPFDGLFHLVDPSLLVDYRFEDDVKGTSVRNQAGSTNGQRLGASPAPRIGQVGNAWLMGGGTSVDTGLKLPAGEVSISIMVNIPAKLNRQLFFSDHTDVAMSGRLAVGFGGNQFFIRVCNGTSEFIVSAGFINGIPAGTMTQVGAWLSADGSTLKIYRNGFILRTIATGLTFPVSEGSSNLVIGNTKSAIASLVALNCVVDNFKVFNRALTDGEWKQLATRSPKVDSRWSSTKRGVNTLLGQGDRQVAVWAGNSAQGRVSAKSGKVMFEYTDTNNGSVLVGVGVIGAAMNTPPGGGGGNSYGYNAFDGNKYYAGVPTAYGASFGVLAVIGVCVDFDANTLTFYKDGVSQGVAYNIAPGTEFYPQVGSASGGDVQFGGLLNLGEDGFAYPIAGYTRWDVAVDLQLKIEALAYPFKDDRTGTVDDLKDLVGSYLRISSSSFRLGDVDGNFDRPSGGLTTLESTVQITSLDPRLHFNGSPTSTVTFRYPVLMVTDITKHVASVPEWANDVDYGWYNDSVALNGTVPLINLPAICYSSLKNIGGEFAHDPDNPGLSTGSSAVQYTIGALSPAWLGTFDGSISVTAPGAGMQVHLGDAGEYEATSAVREVVKQTIPVGSVLTLIEMKSGRDSGYVGSKRGCKYLRFEFNVLG